MGFFYSEGHSVVGIFFYFILWTGTWATTGVTQSTLYAIQIEYYFGTAYVLQVVTVLYAPYFAVVVVKGRKAERVLCCDAYAVSVGICQAEALYVTTSAHGLGVGVILAHVVDGGLVQADVGGVFAVGIVFDGTTTVVRHVLQSRAEAGLQRQAGHVEVGRGVEICF